MYYVPYHSPIHPGRVVTTFSAISTIVESLNGSGVSLSVNTSNPESTQNVGKALLKAALITQLAIMCLFVFLATHFHRRCYKAGLLRKNLKSVLITLYCSCALITIRTIYRTYEYYSLAAISITPGFDPNTDISPVVRYEWYFWVFESLIMLANSVLLNARHPGRYLPKNINIYLAEDGVTEIEGPGYLDKRPFLITLIDPFDLMGLVRGRDKKERYWEHHERIPPKTESGV
jgi:hypothetical protein